MTKVLSTLSALTLSLSTLYSSEVEMKASTGYFYTGASGKLIYQTPPVTGSSATFNFSQKTQAYFDSEIWVDVPFFPHIRLEYTNATLDGISDIEIQTDLNPQYIEFMKEFGLDLTQTFSQDSTLDVNFYDAIAYYQYLEKTPWPTIGVGAGVKSFKYVYSLNVVQSLDYQDYSGANVPMIYLYSRYYVPEAEFALESDLKWYIFGDSTIFDWRAKADLMVDFNKEFSAGVELGYRHMHFNIKGKDVDSVAGNATFSGIYFGLIGLYAKQ